MTDLRPDCFGKYRSPQQDAEACCEDCAFNARCMSIFKGDKMLRCEGCNSADYMAISPGDEATNVPTRVWRMACWKAEHRMKSRSLRRWFADIMGKALSCY